MGAVVRQVGEVLERAHALFGQPGSCGGVAASNAGSGLASAADLVRTGRRQMTGLSGALPAGYTLFAAGAGAALEGASVADNRLSGQLQDAAGADRSGRSASGSVVTGAASDTATLAPVSGTPAGQRTLITALRSRVAQQQHIVDTYKARDARLAAVLRSLGYGRERGGGGVAVSQASFGGGAAGGNLPLSGLGGALGPLGGLAGRSHARTSARPGLVPPGRVLGAPLGTLTISSGPREVAAAIVHEAQRRGYSPYQTTAILATAIQESDLSPRAVSPNRQWESIFQQDASYSGRHNPNLAIYEFFNRLDRHGGASSPDIWKSIFWLQQRPGEPSADAAYAHGRQAYLGEIEGQHRRAVGIYREIVGSYRS